MMSFSFPHYHLLVMSKAPVLGRVKTRMQPHLSQQQSLGLHTALTQHCLSDWLEASVCPVNIWVGGHIDVFERDVVVPLKRDNVRPIRQQPEGDLGARMSFAVQESLSDDAKGIILVGTDCPFVDAAYITSAITALEQGSDVVIGPANDGGYVLMGMRHYCPTLFTDIQWGSDTVLETTEARISSLGLSYHKLAPQVDIDLASDLKYLSELNHAGALSLIHI